MFIWSSVKKQLFLKFPTKAFFLMGLSLLLAFSSEIIVRHIAEREIREVLDAPFSTPDVLVNGAHHTNPTEIITALRSMSRHKRQHTHTAGQIKVDIRNGSHFIHLVLERDSESRDEYWVFYPRYYVTSINEVAAVRTRIFEHTQASTDARP
jgi:hypothetical protein